VALAYNGVTDPPSATRFAIDWSTDIGSKWNKAARDFFTVHFVCHVDEYKRNCSLPDWASEKTAVYNNFSELLKAMKATAKRVAYIPPDKNHTVMNSTVKKAHDAHVRKVSCQ
jgi:hypothetical protein